MVVDIGNNTGDNAGDSYRHAHDKGTCGVTDGAGHCHVQYCVLLFVL